MKVIFVYILKIDNVNYVCVYNLVCMYYIIFFLNDLKEIFYWLYFIKKKNIRWLIMNSKFL